MRRRFALALWLAPLAVRADPSPQRVRVVSESWAWLIRDGGGGRPEGPIAEFIARMNEVQAQFRFELQIVPRLRVDLMFRQGEADVFPLRTVAWTDPALKLRATRTLLKTGDLYIARADHPLRAAVFQDLPQRRIAGVRGYHYAVFGNNPDANWIRAHFKAELLPSNESVIEFVRLGRAEVGIVPEAIMVHALRDARLARELVVSPQYDSRVELSHLVREGGPISVEAMNGIVELLERAGHLQRLHQQLALPH
jgi:ABC-type amino acid transport substrate-binding protein